MNTSYSLLAFAYFCWSSFRSRWKVRISFDNSGCFSLQKFTSSQGLLLHFAWLWPDAWHIAHTFTRLSWTFGKLSRAFCFPCKWLLGLSSCTSSSLRFSDSSRAFRSKGLWFGAIGANPMLSAAASGTYDWGVSRKSSSALVLDIISSRFGSSRVGCWWSSDLILLSSASSIRLFASNTRRWEEWVQIFCFNS